MPKRNAMKNPGEDLADQLNGLREQLTVMGKGGGATEEQSEKEPPERGRNRPAA